MGKTSPINGTLHPQAHSSCVAPPCLPLDRITIPTSKNEWVHFFLAPTIETITADEIWYSHLRIRLPSIPKRRINIKHTKIAGARIGYPSGVWRHIACSFFFFILSKIKGGSISCNWDLLGWLPKCRPSYLFRIKVFGLDSCYCFLHISFIATKGNIVRNDVSYEFNNISFLSIDMLISYNVD